MFGLNKNEKEIAIKDFLDKHLSDKLIILLDPKDDSLYMKYGKVYVLTRIKSMDGKDYDVVKNVLKHSRFKTNIDRLIGAMAESMQLSLREGNQFWQFLDGALYAISKKLSLNKKANANSTRESGSEAS